MTRGPGDKEIRETIAQSGDRWSVTKWPPAGQVAEKSRDKSPRTVIGGHTECPPTDQFPDEHLGAEREKQESTDQSSGYMVIGVHGHRGLVLHAVKLGLWFPARALRMDLV